MGQFGELFGPGKLRKESAEDEGTGERFEHGPLDLEAGVIAVRPRARDEPAQGESAQGSPVRGKPAQHEPAEDPAE